MNKNQSSGKASFVPDSLALGMVVMLGMSVIQRAVGFVRSILFCKILDDHLVGLWSLSYVFLITVTPMVLLGLPGSMPRYVEHYRQRGHLIQFVRRIMTVTGGFCAIFVAGMVIAPQRMAWLVYSNSEHTPLIYALALASIALITFFVVNELVSSLRQVRVSSIMYFLQGVLFTLIGVLWISYGGKIQALILSFAIATTIALIPGIYSIIKGWSGIEEATEPFDRTAMWRKLIPYAAAIWAMNLLVNAFEMADRVMILHFYPGSELEAQSAIGQYHSSRIFAILLLSVSTMIAGILMPYFTADWEQGKRDRVKKRIRQSVLLMSIMATVGAAVILLVAPWLFENLLENRYTQGLELMPMAFLMCTWASLTGLAHTYMLLVEKGKYVAWVFGLGLLVNIALNALLLPMWGLFGAVVATLAANGFTLGGILVCNSKLGLTFDQSSFYACMLPATILAGPIVSLVSLIIVMAASKEIQAWSVEGFQLISQKLRRPLASS